jgi:signal transduction histidine kinase
LETFRLIAGLAAITLAVIVVRGLLTGASLVWPDFANALFFVLIWALSRFRPDWLKALYWLGLASILLNTAGEALAAAGGMTHPYLLLLPLLVLYGVLLGDIWVSLVAFVGVHAIYLYAWFSQPVHDNKDFLIVTNLCLLTVITAAASFWVWRRHSTLLNQINRQAADLRKEVENRLRLHALIVHDIGNPLMVLLNAVAVDDRHLITDMAERISAIIESTAGLAEGESIKRSAVTFDEICDYLKGVFSTRLAKKNQSVSVTGEPKLSVTTDLTILCNSVLSNALNNAMKFSPRDSVIEIAAEPEGKGVRIAINDRGPGLPQNVLVCGPEGKDYPSTPGSEGETGSGYGLKIAALCAERLGGLLEVRNRAEGGAAVSIVLPCAS